MLNSCSTTAEGTRSKRDSFFIAQVVPNSANSEGAGYFRQLLGKLAIEISPGIIALNI
jgi:hypothetical protein